MASAIQDDDGAGRVEVSLTPEADCDLKPEGSITRNSVRTILSLSSVTVHPACPQGVEQTILVRRIVSAQPDIRAKKTSLCKTIYVFCVNHVL